jgi:hypothetical protein
MCLLALPYLFVRLSTIRNTKTVESYFCYVLYRVGILNHICQNIQFLFKTEQE